MRWAVFYRGGGGAGEDNRTKWEGNTTTERIQW